MNPKALLYNCAIEIINTLEENSYLKKENERLKKDLKEYQDMVFNFAMNRPHPTEAMLTLMASGNLSLHKSKDQA